MIRATMVRDAHRRIRKYEKNIDAEQTKRKLQRIKGVMVDLETPYLAQIAEIERKVKRICEVAGVQTHLVAQYINYARQLYSKSKRFSGVTLTNEAQYLTTHWISRGLLCPILQPIAQLFGLTVACVAPSVAPYTAYNVFKTAWAYNSIIQGTWVYGAGAEFYYGVVYNNSNAQNDGLEFKFSHQAGNYTLCFHSRIRNNAAIGHIYVDGVLQGTIDFYNVALVRDTIQTLPITITADGHHTLRIIGETRNPLSTGWYLHLKAWWIRD